MRQKKSLAALLLCALLAAVCAGCGLKSEGFALPHFDGMSADGSYDSAYFYRNDLTVFGGDAGCVYVPADRDETYGGWFYMYMSGNGGVYTEWYDDDHAGAITVLRSRDLNDWELCGAVDDGFSILIERGEWVYDYCWAPEVIYDEAGGRYFMYFNARTPENPEAPSADIHERFFMAIAVSDSPVGPFRLVSSENVYGDPAAVNPDGKALSAAAPPVDFRAALGLEDPFPVIDFSPFIDDDGTMYMYFVKHLSVVNGVNSVWVMRMKDFVTPDFTSLRMISRPSYRSVVYEGGDPSDEESYRLEGKWGETPGMIDEGVINEGPNVRAHTDAAGNKRYYLTYSPLGFGSRNYDVKQAVSDSPFGPFVKLPADKAAVIGANSTNDYMTGTGHHCFIEAGDETFCIYWAHNNPYDGESSGDNGRIYAVDRVFYVRDEALGYDVLYGNGPTKSVQPKPAMASGWRNIAGEAKVSATHAAGKESLRYLTDGLFVTHEAFGEWEFRAKKSTVITLSFETPREIGAILVYNSFDYDFAFSKVDRVVFDLAERPDWYEGKYNGKAYLENLGFSGDYLSAENGFMRQGGAAVASFRPVKVSKIRLSISEKFTRASGGKNDEIRVSDIAVLGK